MSVLLEQNSSFHKFSFPILGLSGLGFSFIGLGQFEEEPAGAVMLQSVSTSRDQLLHKLLELLGPFSQFDGLRFLCACEVKGTIFLNATLNQSLKHANCFNQEET